MPRVRRLNLEGYWYHICIRGQRKQPLFFSPEDRIKYLSMLDEAMLKFDCKLGAFILMTNHIHVLAKMGKFSFGKVFRSVHSKFALYFNEHRKTVGHVFQNRPLIKIILSEKYLYSVINYIHNNSVRANIVEFPEKYRWSSIKVDDIGKFENLILNSWHPPEIFGKFDYYLDNKIYIGRKDEYLKLEKRCQDSDNYIKQSRKKNEIEDVVEKLLAKENYIIQELKKNTKKSDIILLRRMIMVYLYNYGFTAKGIAKYFNRTPAVVFHAIKILSQDNDNNPPSH